MVQVWVRLGGYIEMPIEDQELLEGEEIANAAEIVMQALKNNGFILDGEAYACKDGDDLWEANLFSNKKLIFEKENLGLFD